MANKCKICKKFISTIDGAKCSKCLSLFHPVCLKLSPAQQVSSKWRCDTCKNTRIDSEVSHESRRSQSPLQAHERVGSGITSIAGSSLDVITMEVRRAIREEMLSFREDLERISTTISNLSIRVDNIETRLMVLEEQFSDRERTKAQDENMKYNEIITQLQIQLNDREQEYFSNDIEISGIHEGNGENLLHVTRLIGNKLGVELEERDIVLVERVGPKRTVQGEIQARPRPITVKLARRALRDQLLRAARIRRGADTEGIVEGSPRRFYINERLTRLNKQLFHSAREEGRRKGWRYVWTRRGRIFIRQDANATSHRIRTEADVRKFFVDSTN